MARRWPRLTSYQRFESLTALASYETHRDQRTRRVPAANHRRTNQHHHLPAGARRAAALHNLILRRRVQPSPAALHFVRQAEALAPKLKKENKNGGWDALVLRGSEKHARRAVPGMAAALR